MFLQEHSKIEAQIIKLVVGPCLQYSIKRQHPELYWPVDNFFTKLVIWLFSASILYQFYPNKKTATPVNKQNKQSLGACKYDTVTEHLQYMYAFPSWSSNDPEGVLQFS